MLGEYFISSLSNTFVFILMDSEKRWSFFTLTFSSLSFKKDSCADCCCFNLFTLDSNLSNSSRNAFFPASSYTFLIIFNRCLSFVNCSDNSTNSSFRRFVLIYPSVIDAVASIVFNSSLFVVK